MKVLDMEVISVKEYEKMKNRICKVLKFLRNKYYKPLLCIPSSCERESQPLKSEIYEIWKENKRR